MTRRCSVDKLVGLTFLLASLISTPELRKQKLRLLYRQGYYARKG